MKVPHIDPDSVFGKILTSFIDKLILGILAGIIILLIQSQIQEDVQLKEESFAVARVRTDMLIEQRNALAEAMTKYFHLVGSGDIFAKGKIESEKDELVSSKLLDDIRIIIFNMGVIDEALSFSSLEGKELIEEISTLNSKLKGQKNIRAEIKEEMEVIREKYRKFIITIKKVTRNILKEEFKESLE
ncbi:hypothetical protein GF339_02305 [candidate division KSB3 bacterium]|uniref:Uncharacterized protein n=1 Tax=candidate division KSB3 bacterium TaxID=2044937 RepID=A0A9D5Q4B4_9BACT|nr:hypothetical protein [candidate division KSB3 bacterium]MBD3323385.1 hypothetical protein [candidate division KSB3 bacterium]